MKRLNEQVAARRTKILILVGSIVTIGLLASEAWRENFGGAWRAWQTEYRSRLKPRYRAGFSVELRQVFLPDLGRVDRCQSCHIGIDDPAMKGQPQPLTAHPGNLLAKHTPDNFGCTICHEGQGRATYLPDAHGEGIEWNEPLVDGQLVYVSCARCHVDNMPFGETTEFFGGRVSEHEIFSGQLTRTIPGAKQLNRGKQLFVSSGCLGCHSYRGFGGTLGPDLTHVGDQEPHDYDYSNLPPGVPHTPLAWLEAHFLSPGTVSPGSAMPNMGLSRDDAAALAAYMRSLRAVDVPAKYRAPSMSPKGEPASGAQLFGLFCAGCHGRDLRGGKNAKIHTPSLANPDFLSVASDEFIKTMILHGRSGTLMPAWSKHGLTDAQVTRIVGYIRSHESKGANLTKTAALHGSADSGRALYGKHCANCHGLRGEGGIGTAVLGKDFLMLASDRMILRTILEGRPQNGMPSWHDLSGSEVADLLAFLRAAEGPAVSEADVESQLAKSRPGAVKAGEVLYQNNCASCHGGKGEGALGPSLSTPEFLSTASDTFLIRAIRDGRPDTAMPAWKRLSATETADLVQFLRSLAPVTFTPAKARSDPGDADYGSLLYRKLCAECHGEAGTGGPDNELANPVFTATASDGFLFEAIRRGRSGTKMPAYGANATGSHATPAKTPLSDEQIAGIVAYLHRFAGRGERTPVWPSTRPDDAKLGREVFEGSGACMACHGEHGEGALGPGIANPRFLDEAGPGFVMGTIVHGREGTAMRKFGSWGTKALSPQQVKDTVAYLRVRASDKTRLPRRFPSTGTVGEGRELYERTCAKCHGPDGKGVEAPSLNTPEFLNAATDGFLLATIARGRRDTKMVPFGPSSSGGEQHLSAEEMRNIVHFLRSWQSPSTVEPDTDLPRRGKALYERVGCFTCHGRAGKGGVPDWNYAGGTVPSLNNLAEQMGLFEPEEVKAVLDAMRAKRDLLALKKLPPLEDLQGFQDQYKRVRELIQTGKTASKRDVNGPPPPLNMPSWREVLSPREIEAIIAYCLSLQKFE